MTIPSYDNRRTYAGDGSTTVFAFPPQFGVNSDLVVQIQAADGTITTKTIGSDYAVSGAGNPAGGSVTMTVAPITGTTLIIYRDVPLTQSVDLQDGGPLPANTINRALDRITMWGQRLKEQIIALSALATQTAAGLMSAADKLKLDGIQAGAQVNTVTSVAGKTGAVTLVKGDVGLGNVDNTSDANKPISTATQAALNLKANTSALAAVAFSGAKADVGLGNVDNTSDANKPVSTAQQAALDAKLTRASNLSDLTNVATARTNLGGGATGISVFQAANSATALTAIGATATGSSLVTAANAGVGRSILGLVPGTDVQAFSARLAEIASIAWAQGDILYFNGTSLVRLAAGTAGQFFRTGGPSGTPDWASIAGGGDMLRANNLSDVANVATARANIGAGTVASVGLSAPTGLSVSGSPVTSSGTLALSYTAGYQGYTTAEATKLAGIATGAQPGTVTSVDMTVPAFLSVSGGPVTGSGTFALGLSGTALPAANGGTGQTGFTVGDILYADSTTTLAKLADVAGGNVLRSGGVGAAPSWGKVGLTTHVSGTLAVANGGTGATALATAANVQAGAAFIPTMDVVLSAMDWGALTDGATIAVDHAGGVNRAVTIAGNRTISNPTNPKPGWPLNIEVTQDGTGSRTLSWGANFSFGAAGAPTLSTAAGAIDLISFICRGSSKFVFIGINRGI